MKRSNRLVILVGVLLAVLAFVGIVVVLNQGNVTTNNWQSLLRSASSSPRRTSSSATRSPRTRSRSRRRLPDAAPTNALHDPSEVGGQPALLNVPAGSQVHEVGHRYRHLGTR